MSLALDYMDDVKESYDEGYDEGEARGRTEGEAARSRTIALRLLQGGMPMEQVAAYTDLTADQVRELGQQ